MSCHPPDSVVSKSTGIDVPGLILTGILLVLSRPRNVRERLPDRRREQLSKNRNPVEERRSGAGLAQLERVYGEVSAAQSGAIPRRH